RERDRKETFSVRDDSTKSSLESVGGTIRARQAVTCAMFVEEPEHNITLVEVRCQERRRSVRYECKFIANSSPHWRRRWERRYGGHRFRRTSGSGGTTRARSSMVSGGWSRWGTTCRCTWARCR